MKNIATIGQSSAIRFGSSYKSSSAIAANAPETVFAPGANVNGAYLWSASFAQITASGPQAGYVAKTSAPASAIDGDVVCGIDSVASATNNLFCGRLSQPVFIPPGRGLYFISGVLETWGYRAALFTLL